VTPRRALLALLLGGTLLFAGCDGDGAAESTPEPTSNGSTPTATMTAPDPANGTATPDATPTSATGTSTAMPTATATTPPEFGPVSTEAILGGRAFDRPVELIANAVPGEIWVVDQRGDIRSFDTAGEPAGVVLDIRDRVSRRGSEEGLLSAALDPEFASNGHLWVYYSVQPGVRRTRLARIEVSDAVADPGSELAVLEVTQPFGNHNGGSIRFGPDGMLYLSLGDGGSGGDPLGNGQNRETLLGSVLRIDVRDASEATPYAVPADNPFLDEPDARDEIWAYGFRNPWRMSFDAATGALWLGDVGQSSAEEIDLVERGGNYGWNRFEGFACFNRESGCDREGLTQPVFNYTHPDFGRGVCSVTGGVVYRANRVGQIANAYVFGDFCSGQIWAIDADAPDGAQLLAEGLGFIASFAHDADGEVLVLIHGAPIVRIVAP
jgi:glucose/arabinose dehydrogenase